VASPPRPPHTLRQQLRALIFAATLPLGLIAVAALVTDFRSQRQASERELTSLARIVEQNATRFLHDLRDHATALVEELNDQPGDTLHPLLERFVRIHHECIGVEWRPAGGPAVRAGITGTQPAPIPATAELDKPNARAWRVGHPEQPAPGGPRIAGLALSAATGEIAAWFDLAQLSAALPFADDRAELVGGIAHREGPVIVRTHGAAETIAVGSDDPAVLARLARPTPSFGRGRAADGTARFYANRPMTDLPWVAFASVPVRAVHRSNWPRAAMLAGWTTAALVLGWFAAGWMGRRLEGTIGRLAAAAQREEEGAAAAPVPEEGTAETIAMARAFNRLLAAQSAARDRAAAEERRLYTLLDHLPVFLIRYDAEGRLQWGNRVVRDTLGLSTDELRRTDILARVYPDPADRTQVLEHMMRFDSTWLEMPVQLGPGRTLTMSWMQLRLPDGAQLGIGLDLTERQQAERAVRESRERFEGIVQSIDGIVWEAEGPAGPFTFVSQQAERILGYPVQRWLEEPRFWLDHTHPEDRTWVPDFCRQECLAGRDHHFDFRMIAADGRAVWLHDAVRPVQRGGRVVAWRGVMVDITDRQLAEQAQRESEQRYRLLFSANPLPLLVLDLETLRFLEVNDAAAIKYGWSREEFLALTARDIRPLEDQARFDESLAETRAAPPGIRVSGLWRHRTKSGALLDVEIVSHRIVFTGREADLVLVQDVTTQLRAERERAEFDRRLQDMQKLESLGVLAGGIAHDFNNLLTGILGQASLARLGLPPASPLAEPLGQIETAAHRAADLCRQMLAYSGRGRFDVRPLDLSQMVAETHSLLQLSISKRATLVCDLAPALPPVRADATQLRQVIMNLTINASEAIGDRPGTISLSTARVTLAAGDLADTPFAPDLPGGDYVRLEVRDDGCGMDAATRERIFDPFFTTKFTGRGVGLAAVLGIVRGHRGAIAVESTPGHGTTFRLFLPAMNEPVEAIVRLTGTASAALAAAVPEPAAAAAASDPRAGRGRSTVLVVDDEEPVRSVAASLLRAFGYEVATATDGQAAVDHFAATPARYDVVLLDLTMPRMDGDEACRELRRMRPEVKVVLMSGFDEQDASARFAGLGLNGFLPKPFTADALLERVRTALG
jgi:two-component system cell cycle sensor histidine kinase/response regulator CckA